MQRQQDRIGAGCGGGGGGLVFQVQGEKVEVWGGLGIKSIHQNYGYWMSAVGLEQRWMEDGREGWWMQFHVQILFEAWHSLSQKPVLPPAGCFMLLPLPIPGWERMTSRGSCFPCSCWYESCTYAVCAFWKCLAVSAVTVSRKCF